MKKELLIPKVFLRDVEDIHLDMLKVFSDDISTICGEFAYDSTRGAAEYIAETREMVINYLLAKAFTSTSDGEHLDYIGEMCAVFRKPSTASTGYITFIGKGGTLIEKGTIVSTEDTDLIKSISFETLERARIPFEGDRIKVKARCIEKGSKGNIKSNSITILVSNIKNITKIENDEFKNGTDEEDEEAFRERIKEKEQEEQLSGADVDYERWAKEVDGVGYAYCRETFAGPGTVKVLVLDKNRKPASEELLKKVKEYIYPDLKEGQLNRGGKAPIGIERFECSSPKVKELSIKADFIITEGFKKETVLEEVKEALNKYLNKVDIEGTISYNMVSSIIGIFLVEDKGIKDFTDLTVNDSTRSIKLDGEIAVVKEVVDNG